MGRHKLPEDKKKKRHTFRMTKDVKDTLKQNSKASGQTMSGRLEFLILNDVIQEHHKLKALT
jgi:hypothetical protein